MPRLTTKQKQKIESALYTLCDYRQVANQWGWGDRVGLILKELEVALREDAAIPDRYDDMLNDEGDLTYRSLNPLPTPTQVRIIWEVEDISTERPDWTEERCEEWLLKHGKHIAGRSVEEGWAIIRVLLGEEDEDELQSGQS